MAGKRNGRISEEVLRVLASAMRTLKDPRLSGGLVSIVHCDVTGDLRFATVYVSVLGSDEDKDHVIKGLKSASGFLRHGLSQKLQLRYTPELIFKLDDSISHGAHISELLNKSKTTHSDEE